MCVRVCIYTYICTYTHTYSSMKRKRNACFRKIQNCVLLCDVLNRKNSCTIQDYVYTIQVTLLNPVSKKCNEKIIWAKRKKKKRQNGYNPLHSVCIWPRFRYLTIRVYTQVIWNVCPYKISAALHSRTESLSFIPGFSSFPEKITLFCYKFQSET